MFLRRETLYIFYSNVKFIGSVNTARTGSPFFLAGCHLGMERTTRAASRPQPPPMSRRTFTLLTEPSSSTTNVTNTLPEIWLSFASWGYCVLSSIYLYRASIPPGNSGSSSNSAYSGNSSIPPTSPSATRTSGAGVHNWSSRISIPPTTGRLVLI